MKSSEECIGGITFNITQDDVNAFAAIGASFYVSDPMDVVNGGKLYFVPPKNFSSADSPFAQPQHTTSDLKNPSSDQDCTTFVPNAETLENGVWDFNTDIQAAETEYEEGEDDPNEDEVYDMFSDLDLSENVQDHFDSAEHYSCDEDAVLDNSGDEQENVTPLKPQPKKKVQILKRDGIKLTARKELNPPTSSSPGDIHIDLMNSNIQPSRVNELIPETSQHSCDTEIDLTGKPKKFCQPKNPEVLIDLTASASNASQQVFTYDSEPVSNNNTSFLSDSSLSTSHQKPHKFEKVEIDEERMKRAPVKIVDEVPWDLSGDCIFKLNCSEQNYIKKYEDGQWFYLWNSTRNGLRGHRKTRKCIGSFICQRGNCPKLTTEDIVNTIDFHCVSKDSYVCACCGHPAERIYCSAIKAVEFDRSTQTLTYQHQGDHICQAKPNVRQRRKILDTMPIPITGYTKLTKYMEQCMYHYIDQEDYDTGVNVSESLCIDNVVAQVKKMRKYPNRSIHWNDELDSFSHVTRIQESLLKSDKDKYLV